MRFAVDVGDGDSVVPREDSVAVADDFERVPFAGRACVSRVGSGDVVDRRRVLIVLEFRVFFGGIVEDLDLEAGGRF